MKKLFVSIFVIAAGLLVPQTLQAQGFLGKINKGLEKVNKALDKTSDKAAVATGQAVDLGNGVTMVNPIAKSCDITLVGVYGVSTSENYGNVEVILKVNMKDPETRITFGGDLNNGATIAYDEDGNSYEMVYPTVSSAFKVTEGIPVKISLVGKDAFQKVRKSATKFPVMNICTFISYDQGKFGQITFKNVPIQWDVEH